MRKNICDTAPNAPLKIEIYTEKHTGTEHTKYLESVSAPNIIAFWNVVIFPSLQKHHLDFSMQKTMFLGIPFPEYVILTEK
jgi:hypothetical protein